MIPFIRPSRRGWYVALNAIIWYLVARVNHNLIALIIAWGSLALLAVSFLSAFLSLRKIRVTRGTTPEAQVGRLLNIPFRCLNYKRRKRQPFVILENLPFADQTLQATPCPALPKLAEITVDRIVMPVKRGEFKLHDITVRDSDPAGLFLRERQLELPDAVIVYPHPLPVRQLYLPTQETFNVSTADSPIAASGNSQEFYGVREYHPTDGMRYIHWKSSAKHRRFMVREFERAAALNVLILVDAQKDFVTPKTEANLETAITLAASICKYLTSIYCSLGFAAGGDQCVALPPRDAPVAIPDIMYRLATLGKGEVTAAQALDAVLTAMPDNAVVFAFTLNRSQETQDMMDLLRQRGFEVRWFLAEPKDFMPARKRKKEQQHQDCEAEGCIRVTPDMSPDDIFPQRD